MIEITQKIDPSWDVGDKLQHFRYFNCLPLKSDLHNNCRKCLEIIKIERLKLIISKHLMWKIQ